MSEPMRVPNVLSTSQCRRLRNHALAEGLETGKTGEELMPVGRSSSVAWLEHASEFDDVFATVVATFNEVAFRHYLWMALRTLELPQISRYRIGDFYAWHTDVGEEEGIRDRKLSMSVELSEPGDYEGGELAFSTYQVPGRQTIGSALIFLPNIRHQVSAVTRGERYSLVAWAA